MVEPELGQVIFSNAAVEEYEVPDYIIRGLDELGEAIVKSVNGIEWENHPGRNNAYIFDNEIFVMQAYCWCDGSTLGHESGCPPNFIFKDFKIRWYKYLERSMSQNKKISKKEWLYMLKACIASLEDKTAELKEKPQ